MVNYKSILQHNAHPEDKGLQPIVYGEHAKFDPKKLKHIEKVIKHHAPDMDACAPRNLITNKLALKPR